MPARKEPKVSTSPIAPKDPIVPAGFEEDDALWLLLSAYSDGEASPGEIERVESLLKCEPAVAREFAFMQLTSHSVREFAELDPPPAMTDAIFAATTRRITVLQRFQVWWCRSIQPQGPTLLRVGGAALASCVLAGALWSRHSDTQVGAPDPIAKGKTIQLPEQPPKHGVVITAAKLRHGTVSVTAPAPPAVPAAMDMGADDLLRSALASLSVSSGGGTQDAVAPRPITGMAATRHKSQFDKGIKPKQDATPVTLVAARGNVEERHMPAVAENGGKSSREDDLGPDVDTQNDTRTEEVARIVTPPANDEPPISVSAVSYRPGSISDKTRNAPPMVQSLYTRTQDAIRRQHELQQYGGYGKDAYNNIQRGEVGLSLVGGRF